jgi:hypothetical protein
VIGLLGLKAEKSAVISVCSEVRDEAIHLRPDRNRSQMRCGADINEAAASTDLSAVCLRHYEVRYFPEAVAVCHVTVHRCT